MAKSRICSVAGCGKPSRRNRMCVKHATRMDRHGDPLAGKTERNALQSFYENVVLNYEGDDCLIWPYAKTHNGYGQIRRSGRTGSVSRQLCEDVYGPPPTPQHEAAHSCGKGHIGCVSKRHLGWKTVAENHADKLLHGTAQRGENHGNAKLTEEEVREIRRLRGAASHREIAAMFDTSKSNVTAILNGRAWGWLKP